MCCVRRLVCGAVWSASQAPAPTRRQPSTGSQQRLLSPHQLLVPTLPGHAGHTCTGPVYLHLHWSYIHTLDSGHCAAFYTHTDKENHGTAARRADKKCGWWRRRSHIASSAGSRDHVTVPSALCTVDTVETVDTVDTVDTHHSGLLLLRRLTLVLSLLLSWLLSWLLLLLLLRTVSVQSPG